LDDKPIMQLAEMYVESVKYALRFKGWTTSEKQ
jgi:hypothetical protein